MRCMHFISELESLNNEVAIEFTKENRCHNCKSTHLSLPRVGRRVKEVGFLLTSIDLIK